MEGCFLQIVIIALYNYFCPFRLASRVVNVRNVPTRIKYGIGYFGNAFRDNDVSKTCTTEEGCVFDRSDTFRNSNALK